jgi:hypothetical protein
MTDRVTPDQRSGIGGDDVSIQVAGTLLGIGLATVPLIVGLIGDGWSIVAVGGAVGLAVTVILAPRNALRASRATRVGGFSTSLKMAAQAVGIGDLLVAAGMLSGAGFGNPVGLVVLTVVIPLAGFLIFGLPAFALAFAVYWPWTLAMRWLGRHVWHLSG